MRVLLVLVTVFVFDVGIGHAQTATPSPTPNVSQSWLQPTVVVDGVPQSAQLYEFSYQTDAGEVAITFLLALLGFSLWAFFLILVLRERNGDGGGA